MYADPAQPLTTTDEKLDDPQVDHDLYDLQMIYRICLGCLTILPREFQATASSVPDTLLFCRVLRIL